MKKKKKLLIFLLVFAAIIISLVFYFKDNTDVTVIEKQQDASAIEAADDILNDLNASFEDMDFEEDQDTILLDSL